MEKAICQIVRAAKDIFGSAELAKNIGVNQKQIYAVMSRSAALPFPAALRLAELIHADPITVTCANAALMEKNQNRLDYLESKILPLEISRIICDMSTRVREHSIHGFDTESSDFVKEGEKPVLQGASPDRVPWARGPRILDGSAIVRSPWALRPIPRWIGKLDFFDL